MSARAAGVGGRLPIFARTFLLLAALVAAYAVAVALLLLRRPEVPALQLSEVVALLVTQMPSSNPMLRVRVQPDPPAPPAADYRSPPPLRAQLARWLDLPESQVRFYIAPHGWLRMRTLRTGPPPPGADERAPLAELAAALLLPAPAQAQAQAAPPPDAPGAVQPPLVQRSVVGAPARRAPQDLRWQRIRLFGAGADRDDDAPARPTPAPLPRLGPYPIRSNPGPGAVANGTGPAAAAAAVAPAPADPSLPALSPDLRRYLPPYAQIPPPDAAPAPASAASAPSPPQPSAPARDRSRAVAASAAAVRIGTPEPLASAEPRVWVMQSDSLLPGPFLAAARQPDGRWRVVESAAFAPALMPQLGLVFLVGTLVLLPLAWWFSRALAAPILRFARAADHMGQDASAPPLPLEGPTEIVRAAASFNAMQSRINRLVHERTQMVGAIAHDLRTPLARLSFRLDQLPAEARAKAAADIAEMAQMIQSALEFIREQQRSGVRERLDLRLLAESVVDDLADLGHDVRLLPGAPAPLHGDPLALRRMVGNLVDNALKYGQRARLQLREEDDGYALWIDDDGPGIDPGQREQLFMPFVRGEASRNRETGGIGLGLASARSVALAHGGDIRLDNRPGGGLRATVLLSRGVPSPRPSPAYAPEAQGVPATGSRG